ncbi:MAG: carbonic anhydrase [Ignavibacteria bacterium]|nr:carbonic anhydrase [Ignavibacteria bacterium]
MKKNKFVFLVALLLTSVTLFAQHNASLSADEALKKLMEGNNRFVEFKQNHPHQNKARLEEVASTQKPFAIIVGCSDSRVPPEIIFDQGMGDLFIIRNAGNVIDDFAMASIEYAVEHLGVRLIVVLGHERCGAVDATIKGGKLPGHLNRLTDEIKPAIQSAKRVTGDLLTNVIYSNTKRIALQINSSEELLKEFVEHKGLKVIPAYYDLDTGKAEVFE